METVEPDYLLTMAVPMEAGERHHQGRGGELAPTHDNSRPRVASSNASKGRNDQQGGRERKEVSCAGQTASSVITVGSDPRRPARVPASSGRRKEPPPLAPDPILYLDCVKFKRSSCRDGVILVDTMGKDSAAD